MKHTNYLTAGVIDYTKPLDFWIDETVQSLKASGITDQEFISRAVADVKQMYATLIHTYRVGDSTVVHSISFDAALEQYLREVNDVPTTLDVVDLETKDCMHYNLRQHEGFVHVGNKTTGRNFDTLFKENNA